MIVWITRAKVGHCQTPICDTRLTAGVLLCAGGMRGDKGKQEKEGGMSREGERLAECNVQLASCVLDGNYLICV